MSYEVTDAQEAERVTREYGGTFVLSEHPFSAYGMVSDIIHEQIVRLAKDLGSAPGTGNKYAEKVTVSFEPAEDNMVLMKARVTYANPSQLRLNKRGVK